MERLLAISFVFMCMCCLCPLANAGTFAGTPEVKVLTPTDTRMAVCTPNEKYLLERGTTTEFRLYIRNDMSDKDVKRVYLYIAADDGFNFSVYPSYLEDVMAEEYKYFDINVTSKPDMPSGNYKVAFLVGTDEYGIGAFEDVVMIKIRDYGTEVHYFLGIGVVLIAILLVTRFIWIWTVNKKAGQQHSRPSLKKSKAVSEYYYKNRSLDNRSDKKKSQDKRREEKKPR